ncbi:MAG: hypothetical protein B7Z29_17645 [Hyphomicrobium sp. 12-62-95]|nr:MAG: hypothetical protein B7Z29_17645 [Hyphomicrobium sp. 12-62-95]
MFPAGPQRYYADHLASGDSYDYRETEVLNGLLQIDEAYFNQAVEGRNPNAGNFLYPLIDHAEFKEEIAAIAGN